MFEDILGSGSKDKTGTPVPASNDPNRIAWNGKCNGIDVDGQHIYFNYVDMSNGRTYNIRYLWPDAVIQKLFKKDDPVEVVLSDAKYAYTPQKCRRMDVRSKKWDHIYVQDVIKK